MERQRHASGLNSRGSCHQEDDDLLLQEGEGEDDGEDRDSLLDPGMAGGAASSSSASAPRSSGVAARRLKETIDADHHWEAHSAENNSIVMKTFQGQFKNTVTCSVCGFFSVTFEPFMYLPVPLPNALTRQTEITFVSDGANNDMSIQVMKILLNLTQADNVSALKKAVGKLLFRPTVPKSKLCSETADDNKMTTNSKVDSTGDAVKKEIFEDIPSDEENKFVASLQVQKRLKIYYFTFV